MGKIGDLWVRLGLKKQDFDKGIKDAEKSTRSFSDVIKSIAPAAKVGLVAMGAAFAKFAKDAVRLTQTWGDEWNYTMAGISAAYQTFVRQLASGEGFNQLFHNMREAYRVAREVAASLDELFERKTSFSYQEADVRRQISEQQLIMRDASKSNAEREAAAQKIIDLNKELGKVKRDIAQQEADDLRKLAEDQTGLDKNQLDYLVKEYNQNREVIKQAREYNKELSRLDSAFDQAMHTRGMGKYAQQLDNERKALKNSASQQVKDVAEMVKGYDKVNDELIRGLAAADVAVINVDTDINNMNTRATSTLGRLSTGNAAADPAEQERKRADQILKNAQDAQKGKGYLMGERFEEDIALLKKYGLETETRTKQYINDLKALLDDGKDIIGEGADEITDVFDDFELDDDLAAMWERDLVNPMTAAVDRCIELAQEFKSAVISGFSDGIQELTDQLMGLEDTNPGRIFQALLSPLADMAIREGEIVMAQGLAIEAVKKSLESLQGVPALIAGASLIAIGAAAKSGLAALAKGGTGTTVQNYGGGSGGYGTGNVVRSELVVKVEGTIKGSDIVISGQNTMNSWGR